MCIWPQQVWPGGNTTSCPSRSSSCTVAFAACGNMVSARQVTKSAMRTLSSPPQPVLQRLPAVRVAARLVAPDLLSLPQHAPQCREASVEHARGARLDKDVAERGGLDRAGQHRFAAGVGGQLAQQLVAGAAADDV